MVHHLLLAATRAAMRTFPESSRLRSLILHSFPEWEPVIVSAQGSTARDSRLSCSHQPVPAPGPLQSKLSTLAGVHAAVQRASATSSHGSDESKANVMRCFSSPWNRSQSLLSCADASPAGAGRSLESYERQLRIGKQERRQQAKARHRDCIKELQSKQYASAAHVNGEEGGESECGQGTSGGEGGVEG
eukprot:5003326-Pleurochrysis_carterae.AAC.1